MTPGSILSDRFRWEVVIAGILPRRRRGFRKDGDGGAAAAIEMADGQATLFGAQWIKV